MVLLDTGSKSVTLSFTQDVAVYKPSSLGVTHPWVWAYVLFRLPLLGVYRIGKAPVWLGYKP